MVFNFACVNFARIFIREALVSRIFYNRENREIKYEWCANSLHFFLTFTTNLKGLNLFSATCLSPPSLTSIIIFGFIQDLF